MTLERTLEEWSVKKLRDAGAHAVKMGLDGVPDRLVLWGRGQHFWIEFKKEKTGRLRPGQKIWKKYLESIGDNVYVIDTRGQLEEVILAWEMSYGPATAKRAA